MLVIDTLKYSKFLQEAGFDGKQSEAIIQLQSDAFQQASETQIATKADIIDLKSEIKELKADIFKWGAGLLLAQAGIIVTLIKLI